MVTQKILTKNGYQVEIGDQPPCPPKLADSTLWLDPPPPQEDEGPYRVFVDGQQLAIDDRIPMPAPGTHVVSYVADLLNQPEPPDQPGLPAQPSQRRWDVIFNTTPALQVQSTGYTVAENTAETIITIQSVTEEEIPVHLEVMPADSGWNVVPLTADHALMPPGDTRSFRFAVSWDLEQGAIYSPPPQVIVRWPIPQPVEQNEPEDTETGVQLATPNGTSQLDLALDAVISSGPLMVANKKTRLPRPGKDPALPSMKKADKQTLHLLTKARSSLGLNKDLNQAIMHIARAAKRGLRLWVYPVSGAALQEVEQVYQSELSGSGEQEQLQVARDMLDAAHEDFMNERFKHGFLALAEALEAMTPRTAGLQLQLIPVNTEDNDDLASSPGNR